MAEVEDPQAKRKKNADAQAAFRARRQSYIKSLEQTVNGLENVVKEMQGMCKSSTDEAKLLRERIAVLEGVIDELSTRLERSGAAAANRPDHCDCCRLKICPDESGGTGAGNADQMAVLPAGEPGVEASWPGEPFPPAAADPAGLGGAREALDSARLEPQFADAPVSASYLPDSPAPPPSSRRSVCSATSAPPRREAHDGSVGMSQYLDLSSMLSQAGTLAVNSAALEQAFGSACESKHARSPHPLYASRQEPAKPPPLLDPLSQEANFQAFMSHHLNHYPSQSLALPPHPQSHQVAHPFDLGHASNDSSFQRGWPPQPLVDSTYRAAGGSPYCGASSGAFGEMTQGQIAYLISLGQSTLMNQQHSAHFPPSFSNQPPTPATPSFAGSPRGLRPSSQPFAQQSAPSHHGAARAMRDPEPVLTGRPSAAGRRESFAMSEEDELASASSPPSPARPALSAARGVANAQALRTRSGSASASASADGRPADLPSRRLSRTGEFAMMDPIAACSASGSSKVNGLPAKVARCEKTLREVQAVLSQVKSEAEEARLPPNKRASPAVEGSAPSPYKRRRHDEVHL